MNASRYEAGFQAAFSLHQQGDLIAARARYEQVIAIEPRHAGALHMLGVLAGQMRQYETAVDLIGKALEMDPQNAAAHCNLASALKELRRLEAALASYDRAIDLRPDYAEAHSNRGVVLAELRQIDAAMADYARAIALKPGYAEAHYHLGNAHLALGDAAAAFACLDRAISINPRHADAYYNRGNAERDLQRSEAALASYDRAIALRPHHAGAHCNRGVVLSELGHFDAALASYDEAIRLDPTDAVAHCNRAKALLELQRLDEALAACDRAIALRPDYAAPHCHRGTVLMAQGSWEAALSCCDRALALDARHADAHVNRGVLFHERGDFPEALACYDRAITVNPSLDTARVNRALVRLAMGDFAEGWNDYEWRNKEHDPGRNASGRKPAPTPWRGFESLAGKTILIDSEQGLGDTIQFCRYAKHVAELGAHVLFRVPRPLENLLQGLAGVSQIVADEKEAPPCDFHCPLLRLPLAFRTTLETIPGEVPYLQADGEKLRLWAERLGVRTKPRVGLVWSGGFRPGRPDLWSVNRRRNVPLTMLAPLADPRIEFFSLQKGETAEAEWSELQARRWPGPQLHDWTHELKDFSDTAALIEHLDLVISVDTSTAHLAAALGKPVWILNRFDTCWRWLLGRSDSPWYPSVRLYRQERPGDWTPVIERVKTDLAQLPA